MVTQIKPNLSNENLLLKDIISDTNLVNEFNAPNSLSNIESGILLVHTLRVMSCYNCPFDNKYLMEYLSKYENLGEFEQVIWFLDQIDNYSVVQASQHAQNRNYLLGYDRKYEIIFRIDESLRDRNILIFKNGKYTGKVLLPFNLEFKSDSLMPIIYNKINEV